MPNKHTYNSKLRRSRNPDSSGEEQEMPGRWLDYGFRFYDSQIARFHSVDPLGHSFSSQSPYVYAGNNPISFIDFMGLSPLLSSVLRGQSSFSFEMTDEDWIKATRPIGLEGVESKEKKKKTDKNTESQTSQQNTNGKKKKDGKGNVAKGQGGGEIAKLFGKYNAGYIADVNSNQLFPNQTYDRDKVVTRYMVEGVGVWILGVVNTGLGAVSGGLAVTFQGQEHILRMKTENYLQNGQGLGIYAINVSAPGAFPRAMLFNAVDGSSIGWHHTIVQGAPTMHYHIYLKFLKELNTIR